MKEILEVAVDMDATRRRDRKDAPYHTLLELVLDLERRAWNCVLHAADAKLLDNVPGLAELIAFDAGTGPRPPFVPEHPWSWEGGGLHPFRILCGQGLAFYEYGPIEPHTANHPAMENGEQMEPLKRGPPVASKILLPALFPRDHAASSAHGISMLRHARETNCVGEALTNERIEYLRSRCRIGAYACRNLVDIVRSNSAHLDGVLGSAVLDAQLHAEGLTRTPSGAITAAPGLYWDEIQPVQASLRHVEETLRVSLEACDTQWFGQPDYDDRRSKLVEASWNRYRFVWARAIALSRRVPDAPTMPPERILRAGYGNAADLAGAILELRDWLADCARASVVGALRQVAVEEKVAVPHSSTCDPSPSTPTDHKDPPTEPDRVLIGWGEIAECIGWGNRYTTAARKTKTRRFLKRQFHDGGARIKYVGPKKVPHILASEALRQAHRMLSSYETEPGDSTMAASGSVEAFRRAIADSDSDIAVEDLGLSLSRRPNQPTRTTGSKSKKR